MVCWCVSYGVPRILSVALLFPVYFFRFIYFRREARHVWMGIKANECRIETSTRDERLYRPAGTSYLVIRIVRRILRLLPIPQGLSKPLAREREIYIEPRGGGARHKKTDNSQNISKKQTSKHTKEQQIVCATEKMAKRSNHSRHNTTFQRGLAGIYHITCKAPSPHHKGPSQRGPEQTSLGRAVLLERCSDRAVIGDRLVACCYQFSSVFFPSGVCQAVLFTATQPWVT